MEKRKRTLFVYGDSFALTFKKHFETSNIWAQNYLNFKNGIAPKHYSEIIAEKLDLNVRNIAFGGCSNYTVFDRFCGTFGEIEKNDIVIVCWTSPNRFPIAKNDNQLIDIIPFVGHPQQNDHVSLNTTNEIAVNRDTYSVYYRELINYVKVVNQIAKHANIIHWTWVDDKREMVTMGPYDDRKIFYNFLKPFKQYETITEETNGLMQDIHYSEKGHVDLANDFLEMLKMKII